MPGTTSENDLIDASVADLGPRDAAQALLRAQLEADASRKQTTTASFRARLRVARHAGVPMVDLLRRSSAARQTVYDAIKAPIGAELDELSALALIASGAAQTVDALSEVAGATAEQIQRVLSSLRHAGYVEVLVAPSQPSTTPNVFSITAKGLLRLHVEIDNERLRTQDIDSWTIFVLIPERCEAAILDAAKTLFGSDGSYGIVHAQVAPSRMRGPELALQVRAPDMREALVIVEAVWGSLRSSLGMRIPATPHIAAVAPPRN
jgi:hypothetical protein